MQLHGQQGKLEVCWCIHAAACMHACTGRVIIMHASNEVPVMAGKRRAASGLDDLLSCICVLAYLQH